MSNYILRRVFLSISSKLLLPLFFISESYAVSINYACPFYNISEQIISVKDGWTATDYEVRNVKFGGYRVAIVEDYLDFSPNTPPKKTNGLCVLWIQ